MRELDAGSVWDDPRLPDDGEDLAADYDVVVVGAGIVGATIALELAQHGRRVALIEACDRPGTGVTGQSTAKVTVGHGLRLSEVRDKHGLDTALEYAAAATTGWSYVRGHSDGLGPAARLVCPHDVYASDAAWRERLERHRQDALDCGLLVTDPSDHEGLPMAPAAVVRYPDQLVIDPVSYVRSLVRRAREHGATVGYGTTVTGVEAGPLARTSRGDVRADHVVLACHVPFTLRSMAFAFVEQRRHYAIAGSVDRPLGASYDVSTGWSTRPLAPDHTGAPRALAVGPGHPAGSGNPTGSLHRLRVWAEATCGMQVTHAWSTQDAFSGDGLPLVGHAGMGPQVWMATGFAAWGLTLGTAAALDIVRRILGGPGQLHSWDAMRPSLLRHPAVTLEVTGRTLSNLAGSALPSPDESQTEVQPGQGRVVRRNGQHVALSRSADGRLTALSARCTHLRCLVDWNAQAQSWDCACHGSRFAPDGAVLHGPALDPLAPAPSETITGEALAEEDDDAR